MWLVANTSTLFIPHSPFHVSRLHFPSSPLPTSYSLFPLPHSPPHRILTPILHVPLSISYLPTPHSAPPMPHSSFTVFHSPPPQAPPPNLLFPFSIPHPSVPLQFSTSILPPPIPHSLLVILHSQPTHSPPPSLPFPTIPHSTSYSPFLISNFSFTILHFPILPFSTPHLPNTPTCYSPFPQKNLYDVHGPVTIFEYSTTKVTLPSCLSVPREHVASQRKWQSADLDLVKQEKKRKCLWPALFRGNVCI